MLLHCSIRAAAARRLLEALARVEDAGFADLLGMPTPRGLYLASENLLFRIVGDDAGVLHTGRSRNDLNATEQRLAARDAWRWITGQILRLARTLAHQAHTCWNVPMPLHTHYQPAVISTYGHWLAGCAESFLRIHTRFLNELPHLNLCPLGAAAIGGTSHPIDPLMTAELLGFDRPFRNSIDAISAKDHLLSLLALCVNVCHLVSRVVQDYRFRTAAELRWFEVPDELAGGSSALPQKKNAWLLELAKTRAAQAIATFTSFHTASFGEPFSNTIASGGEALSGATDTVRAVAQALALLRLHVRFVKPNRVALDAALTIEAPFAQVVAEDLARNGFTARSAHRQVGQMFRLRQGLFSEIAPPPDASFLDPEKLNHGGGAGSCSADETFACLDADIRLASVQRMKAVHRWKDAARNLRATVST